MFTGTLYEIKLEGDDAGGNALDDPELVGIYDADGTLIPNTTNDNGIANSSNSRVLFSPDGDGTYYVAASGASSSTGNYQLSVTIYRSFDTSVSEPDGSDFTLLSASTGWLPAGGSVTGKIDQNGDVDAFLVWLVLGRFYRFDLEGSETGQGTLADPKIGSLDTDAGGLLAPLYRPSDPDGGQGENARITFTLPSGKNTGAYYILVEEDGKDATGTYRLSMTAGMAGSGYGKTYPVEGNLRSGGTLSGTLPVHDGYFGNPYYFVLEDLEVGRYTVSFSTGAIDSIHTFLPRTAGEEDDVWLLTDQAFGRSRHTFDVRPDREGPHYALLYIREGAGGDFTATLEEAPPSLTVGGPAVEGRIKSGGAYSGYGTYMLFYSVDLEDGETYQVDIKGKDTCNDCTMDHTMLGHVQAPDGSFVEDDNNLFAVGGGVGRNTRYVFTADQDGTYFLKVGGRIMTVSDGISRYRRGTFKVSIQEVP